MHTAIIRTNIEVIGRLETIFSAVNACDLPIAYHTVIAYSLFRNGCTDFDETLAHNVSAIMLTSSYIDPVIACSVPVGGASYCVPQLSLVRPVLALPSPPVARKTLNITPVKRFLL